MAMTTKTMIKVKADARLKFQREVQDELTEAGISTVAILIPGADIRALTYQLIGDGKVQVTGMPEAMVLAGTAVWEDVLSGAAINIADTAIRQVNTSSPATVTTLYVRTV